MKIITFLLALCLLLGCLSGCSNFESAAIVATTLPVYEFTSRICQGTDITVARLITENVSCLHDYTLQVQQMQAFEAARAVIISGAGLEDSMGDILHDADYVIDASVDVNLICNSHDHLHGGNHHSHHHAEDPHIWLSPEAAMQMSRNICTQLTALYPQHEHLLFQNLQALLSDLESLLLYGQEQLTGLSCRDLITFHDGFSYFAEAFDLHILESVEEESGSEASAQELIELIDIVQTHQLPAVFTEANGSTAAAQIIANETGACIYALDMAMSGNSYFGAMYHNINTIKEALG